MLGSTASLAADDLSVRCRVRTSPYALNPEFGEEHEMNCTMRKWKVAESSVGLFTSSAPDAGIQNTRRNGGAGQAERNSSSGSDGSRASNSNLTTTSRNSSTTLNLLGSDNEAHHHGPEILLTPVHMPCASGAGRSYSLIRNASRASTPSRSRQPTPARGRPGPLKPRLPPGRESSGGSNSNSEQGNGGRSSSLSRSRRSSSRLRSNSVIAAAAFDVDAAFHTEAASEEVADALNDSATLQSWTIPISDIIVVDVDSVEKEEALDSSLRGRSSRSISPISPRCVDILNITTIGSGYFRITFDSQNSHDVLLAFLLSSLPSSRITKRLWHDKIVHDPESVLQKQTSCCADRDSFDVENLTARELKHRVTRETLLEKVRRRLAHIATQCGELSVNFSETVCGERPETESPLARSSHGASELSRTNRGGLPSEGEGLPTEPKISFEGTPSRDQKENVNVISSITDGALPNDFDLPDLKVRKSFSAEQMLDNPQDPPTPVGTSGSDDEYEGSSTARLKTVTI